MYFEEVDQLNAADTNQDGFFGDTYGQQDNFYSHQPSDIPIASPVYVPQDNFYSHKNSDTFDAFHAQESSHLDSYAPDQNKQPSHQHPTYDSYDAYG